MPEHDANESHQSWAEAVISRFASSEKRSNQMILIGTPAWVRKIIHLMHVAHITEVRDWSRPMPTRNPDEVISLMQRPRVEESEEG